MPDQLLHKFIYVLFSAFTEFLPVSPRAHQMLYEMLTGFQMTDAMVPFVIRLGTLAALLFSCKKRIQHLLRANRLAGYARRHRSTHVDTVAILDTKALKTAVIPILIGLLFYKRAGKWIGSMALLALMLTVNGLVLFWPRIRLQGNKDGRSLSRLDTLTIGISGALAMIPGFSRIGCMVSGGQVRGVDRAYALEMALLLSVPALLGLLVFDCYGVIVAKVAVSGVAWLCYLVMAGLSFGVGYLAIMFLRYLSVKASFSRFSYYSWGMAMFAFILYLLV